MTAARGYCDRWECVLWGTSGCFHIPWRTQCRDRRPLFDLGPLSGRCAMMTLWPRACNASARRRPMPVTKIVFSVSSMPLECRHRQHCSQWQHYPSFREYEDRLASKPKISVPGSWQQLIYPIDGGIERASSVVLLRNVDRGDKAS